MRNLVTHFRRMARNNRWSNDRVYRAVLLLKPGEFEAPRTGFFPSIMLTLNHILEVDVLYLSFLEARKQTPLESFQPVPDPSALWEEQDRVDLRLINFCDGLAAGDCGRLVGTDRGEEGIVEETVGDLLAHLFIHQIHHRGQVHGMLSGTSVAPPQLDEFFLEYDRERRRAEVERLRLAHGKGRAGSA